MWICLVSRHQYIKAEKIADGVSNNDITIQSVENIQEWVVETWIKKSILTERGYSSDDFNPSIEKQSIINEIDDKKLGIIKLNMDKNARMIVVVGGG